MEWIYIVGENGPGGVFSTEAVKEEVTQIRSYFIETDVEGIGKQLIAKLQIWLHGGKDAFTFRVVSAEISHGKSIVVPNGKLDLAFPLRTDVKAKLALWSDMKSRGGEGSNADENKKIGIDGLDTLKVDFQNLTNSWV